MSKASKNNRRTTETINGSATSHASLGDAPGEHLTDAPLTSSERAELLAKISEQQAELERLRDCGQPASEPGEVKKHLRCPLCWDGLGGRARKEKWRRQVSGILQKRCYSCDQCGTEWVYEVRAEVVDDIQYTEIKLAEVRKTQIA